MKKRIAIAALMLTAAIGLAGCAGAAPDQGSGRETGETSSKAAEETGTAAADVSSEDCTLTFWTFPFGTDDQLAEERENYQTMISDFESKNPGIKINIEILPWDNRETKMLTAIAANQGPDIMYLNPDILKLFKAYGILAPVTQYISEDTLKEFSGPLLDNSVRFDGELYGLPCLVDMGIPCYNLDLLEKIGMTEENLPETWDEFDAMLKACKEKDIYGIYYNYSGSLVSNFAYGQFFSEGCDIIEEDGTVVIDNDAGKKVLKRLTDWYQNGYTPADSLSVSDNNSMFMSGSTASVLSSAGAGFYRRLAPDITFNWAAGPVLKGDAGQYAMSTVGSLAVTQTCKNVEAAAKFLEYFTQDEINAKWCNFGGYISPKLGVENPNADLKGYDIILKSLDAVRGEPNHAAARTMGTVFIPDLQAIVSESVPFDDGVAKMKTDIEGIVAQISQVSN